MMDAIRVQVGRVIRWTATDRGAVATEYGLLLLLIALTIVGTVALYGEQLGGLFQFGADSIPDPP